MIAPTGKVSDISPIIKKYRPELDPYEDIYKHFHSNPELSTLEAKTAESIHKHLEEIGEGAYEVKKHIGGHGTAAILRNGEGTTLLLRADIDGLPVLEKTGLPYASKVRMKDAEGKEQPVMHACGHDMHITSLLAAAKLLYDAREEWSGTLILIFQPAEERGVGAKAMVDDGLYTKHKVPEPDVVIGAHVVPERAGRLGVRPAAMMAAADSMKITIHGRGGHGSQPHKSIDAVVMAASTVTRLQTLVSRELSPFDTAVVTVASIHAGEGENTIPEFAELKLNVRTFDKAVRTKVLGGIKRIVQAELDASGSKKAPEYESISTFPLTYNDKDITKSLSKNMAEYYGDSFNGDFPAWTASEDFSILGSHVGKPTCFWVYGGTDPKLFDEHEKAGTADEMPGNHSSYFAPVIQPTLTVAVDGYALAALTWLSKK